MKNIPAKFLTILIAACVMSVCPRADAARIILKNGRVIEGEIVGKTSNMIYVEDDLGVKTEIPVDAVEQAQSRTSENMSQPPALPELFLLNGHPGTVSAVAFSPDGAFIATGGGDAMVTGREAGAVKVWSAATGELLCTTEEYEYGIKNIAISPDGKTLASGSLDEAVALWSFSTCELLHDLKGRKERVSGQNYKGIRIAFSPDGQWLASDQGHVWSVETGELRQHIDRVGNGVVTPDGRFIVSGRNVWSVETGEPVRPFQGYEESVNCSALSPDGKIIATGGEDGIVKLWAADTGKLLHSMDGHAPDINMVAFSPDGTTLVSESGGYTVKLWSVQTGKMLHSIKGHSPVVFSPDSKTMVVAGIEQTVELWSVETGALLHSYEGHQWNISVAAFSPDGKTMASVSNNSVNVWSVETGVLIHTFMDHVPRGGEGPVISPDRKIIALEARNGTVKLWSAETGDLLFSLEGRHPIVFGPDGKTLATADGDDRYGRNEIKIWSLETGALLHSFEVHNDWLVGTIVFSPDGKTIVVESHADDWMDIYYDIVYVWSLETGELLTKFEGDVGEITSEVFSPDGTIMVASTDEESGGNATMILSTETGAMLHTIEGHSNGILSPDGKTVATRGWEGDEPVMLWSAETGDLLHTFEGRSTIIFSPDGKTIAMRSKDDKDNTINLWSVETGALLRSLKGFPKGIMDVVFSPDGRVIALTCELAKDGGWRARDKTVTLWSAETGELLHSLQGGTYIAVRPVFSPDGKIISITGGDSTINLWNPETGQLLVTLMGFDDGGWFAMEPASGWYDCSNCADRGADNGMKYVRWRVGNVNYKPDQLYPNSWAQGLVVHAIH